MKPVVNVVPTKVTSTGGVPIYYGDGYYYGDEHLYYGTWYATDGVLTQGEKPVVKVEPGDVRINIGDDKPIIKVLE